MDGIKSGRIIGSVMGLAVGDALGAPVEGAKPGSIKNAYRRIVGYVDPEGWVGREKIYKWRKPGMYTDDTQRALVLLESLLEGKGLNPQRVAERIVELSRGAEFNFGVYRAADREFRRTVTDLRQGHLWTDSGSEMPGNGAASCIAPVAAYYRNNLDEMAERVAEATLIFNRNPVSISAAAAVSYLIVRCFDIEGIEESEKTGIIESVAEFCREKELLAVDRFGIYFGSDYEESRHIFSDALRGIAENYSAGQAGVADWIVKNAASRSGAVITRPSHGYAQASVAFAIYLAVKNAESFESAVEAAINEGGDADTVAAIVGSVSGSLHGADGIPERWIKGLANRKQIKARAEMLSAGKWIPLKIEDLYEMEYGLTRREHEERLAKMKKYGVDFPEKRKTSRPAAPEPVHGKYDRKRQRRERLLLKQLTGFVNPESSSWE